MDDIATDIILHSKTLPAYWHDKNIFIYRIGEEDGFLEYMATPTNGIVLAMFSGEWQRYVFHEDALKSYVLQEWK